MPVPSHLPLSVVIISLNEEKRIGDCLDSVRELTEDIVVVDSHSRDGTCTLCHSRGARVFQRAWTGYSAQKNFGNAQAAHDWILSLDADERVSPELAAALRREFARGPRCDAYSIRFQNYFGARRIRFGAWNPESHVRLFDRRVLSWNEAEVHEGLVATRAARTGRLAGCIRHLTVDSHAQLAEKSERYGALFAAKARRRTRPPGLLKIWLNPVWRFVRDYVLRLGVLDGGPGVIIAWEAARYTHLKYAGALPVRRFRPAPWLALSGVCALLGLAAVQLPFAKFSAESSVRIASADTDDDFTNMNSLAFDDDDDVVV